jgi:hypothetical protein
MMFRLEVDVSELSARLPCNAGQAVRLQGGSMRLRSFRSAYIYVYSPKGEDQITVLRPDTAQLPPPPVEAAFRCAGEEPAPECFAVFAFSGFFSADRWSRFF